YERGDDDVKASAAVLRAGQRAQRLYAIDEALAYFRAALEHGARDPAAIVGACEGIGDVQGFAGNYAEAAAGYRQALPALDRAGADDARADAYKHLGTVASLSGDTGMAVDYYERSLRLYEARGDVSGQANVLNNLGIVHRKDGRYPQALQAHTKALAIRERIG